MHRKRTDKKTLKCLQKLIDEIVICIPILHAHASHIHHTHTTHARITRIHRTHASHAYITRTHHIHTSHAHITRIQHTHTSHAYALQIIAIFCSTIIVHCLKNDKKKIHKKITYCRTSVFIFASLEKSIYKSLYTD